MRISIPLFSLFFSVLFSCGAAVSAQSSPGVLPTVTQLNGPSGPATTVIRRPVPAGATTSGVVVNLLENGSFASGLDGWLVEEFGGSGSPGTVDTSTQVAQFVEGDSFLVTLQQTVTVPTFATELRFELTASPGFDLSAAFIPDAFEVSLLDGDNLPVVNPWTVGATSSFNLQENGDVNLALGVAFDGLVGTVDVSAVAPGTVVTLYFDYVNADTDTTGGVQIDNVEFGVDAPAGSFIRGDVDHDELVTSADADALLALLFDGAALPLDCSGGELADVADANDNEFITIADYLAVRAAGLGAPLPDPQVFCGFDPSEDTAGFDVIDPAFRATAGDLVVEPPTGGVDRDVFIPVLIDTPVPATGLTLILQYDDAILTPFDPGAGDGEAFVTSFGSSTTVAEPGLLMITVWATNDGETILPGDPGVLQFVGDLQFHLADFAVVPPSSWLPEATIGSVSARATIVDANFFDHHPELLAGEGEFARGDANNDGSVDISDAIYTLEYLFISGPVFPCFDAADSNNSSAVDISDTVYTLEYLFIAGPPPPTPFPSCGSDVGPIDTLDCQESTCQL